MTGLQVIACALFSVVFTDRVTAGLTYRCQDGKQVTYSDEPCLGAKVVDTTPTQGLDSSSGVSRKGADVRNSESRTSFANAVKPVTGMSPDQFKKFGDRLKLPVPDRQTCQRLDDQLPQLEARAGNATSGEKAQADVDLYMARKRFKDLKC